MVTTATLSANVNVNTTGPCAVPNGFGAPITSVGAVLSICTTGLLVPGTARLLPAESFTSAPAFTVTLAKLPANVELALFRIAQEAITNVERHAEASRVTVSLEFADSGTRLTVEDDGIGIDRSQIQGGGDDGHSLGLPGMSERARLIGGRLQIGSEVGKGTTISAWAPDVVSDGQ